MGEIIFQERPEGSFHLAGYQTHYLHQGSASRANITIDSNGEVNTGREAPFGEQLIYTTDKMKTLPDGNVMHDIAAEVDAPIIDVIPGIPKRRHTIRLHRSDTGESYVITRPGLKTFFMLQKGEKVTIGSHQSCNIQMNGTYIFPYHATIEMTQDGKLLIHDHSYCGTYVSTNQSLYKDRGILR